jgi:hypothetical protein
VVLSVAAEAISRINSCEGHSLSVACCMLHQGCVQSSKKLAGLSTESTDPPDSRQKVFFPPHNIICWNTWVTCITRGSFEFPIGFWYFKSNQVVSKSLLSSCKQSFSSGQLYKHHKKLTGSRCSQIWSEKKKIYLKKIPFNRRMDERCVWFSSISRDVTLFSYLKKLPLTSTKK